MKAFSFTLVMLFVAAGQLLGQDAAQSAWHIMPGVVFVNHFPSSPIKTVSSEEYRFDGVGFQFIARAFHQNYPDLALHFSGGINWFANDRPNPIYILNAGSGVGATLKYKSFRTFPLMVGAEWIYPRSTDRSLMLYVGGNAGLHFVDGDLGMNQQTKFGYTLGAGFIVKVFEFGVRYYSFSDLRNLGVHLGLRLNSFPVE